MSNYSDHIRISVFPNFKTLVNTEEENQKNAGSFVQEKKETRTETAVFNLFDPAEVPFFQIQKHSSYTYYCYNYTRRSIGVCEESDGGGF